MARDYQGLRIEEYDVVEAELLAAAAARLPFSMIRLGHCEPRFLGYPSPYALDEAGKSFRRQFGRGDLTDEDAVTIRELLRQAVLGADVVGLGVKDVAESELDELWLSTPGILQRDGLVRGQRFCHVNVHYHLMRSGLLERLVAAWDEVALITCRAVAAGFQRHFRARSVEWLQIPEHATTAPRHRPVGQHWPDAFEAVNQAIGSLGPRVYLVGAGFLGKAYCERIKAVGGLAVDLGSVFDVWADVRSRSGHNEAMFDRYRLPKGE